jgi:hypothetical protein
MVVDAKTDLDAERLAVIETRMDSFVTKEQHERDNGDIKVILAEIRSDVKNLKWQLAVLVAILSSIISFLVSRIPI